MSGLARLEERIAKLEAAATDIREATREAHEAIQTLRVLKRDAVEKVGRTFDELARIYLEGGSGKHRDIPLPTLAEASRRARTSLNGEVG